ncbi:MAG: hypothetical protein ACE5HF_10295 [Gemmatimonadota bacterium]
MTTRPSGPGDSLRDAARGPRRGAATGLPAHGRAVLPDGHSIRWVPDGADAVAPVPGGPQAPYEFFLTQAALRALHRSVAAHAEAPSFGFLAGRLFRCPQTRLHYAVVERLLTAREPFAEEAPQAYLLRAWETARPDLGRRPGVLLGWYHTHELLGPFLSETDVEACRQFFGEPWQCAIVIVPGDPCTGGLFRGLASDEAPSRPSSFYELLDPGSRGGRVADVSVLGWTNHGTDQVTVGAGPGPGEGFEPVADRIPVTAPTIRPEHSGPVPIILPSEPREPLFPRPSRRTRKTVGGILALLAVVAAGVLAVRWARPGPRESAPFVPVTSPAQTSGAGSEVDSLLSALALAVDQYDERKTDFDLGRIGCQLLAGGYDAADRAAIAAAAVVPRAGAVADSATQAEYAQLLDEMDAVNEHFDGSRCPRPR